MGARERQKPSLLLVGSWWQGSVDVSFSRVCKIRHLFCVENQFMSLFILSVIVIGFTHG